MNYQLSRGRLFWCAVICLSVVGSAAPALAGVISYTTEVAEYTIKYDPVFEAPSSTAMLFQPLAFEAISQAAVPPIDLMDGTLIVTVTPLEGAVLDTIHFTEGGDYTLAGAVGETSQAYVRATLFINSVYVKVNGHEVDSVDLDCTKVFEQNVIFSPGSSPNQGFWSLDCLLDVAGALAAAEINGRVTELSLSIDNTLLASSQAASVAFIAKKYFRIDDDTEVVPEPSALALLMAGCCLLLARRRR